MSRYEPTRGRKPAKSTFIIPILISFFIGAGGILYVYMNYQKKTQKAEATENVTVKQVAVSDKFPAELKTETEADLAVKAPVNPVNTGPKPENTALTAPQQASEIGANTKPAPLPDLLSSDSVVRQAIIKLSPGLTTWLNVDQLIRRFFLIINDFSQGQRITSHMSFLRLPDPFFVEQDGNDLYVAPKNYHRYKLFTDAVQAIDAKKAANLYRRFRPLMLQVFTEMGYPKDITLESIVKKAAAEIIAAPVLDGQIMLIRPSVYYRFADPKMEQLDLVHKQLIRMGPENTRIIQAKCREVLVELGKIDLR
ncbi:MAG: DUF3014 domain-containing protein [Gammaproteobacteria bacterium]|nr:DUF3014 domain-containing protein [Gammaproteobacteria bacterium]